MIDLRKAVSRHVVENPSIHIVPRKQRLRLPFISRKLLIFVIVVICLGLTYFFAGQYIPGNPLPAISGGKSNKITSSTSKITEKPEYITILPEGKNIEALGGWARVSPPDRNPVFAYADKIENVSISVSQQPLPESFEKDSEKSIEELAKSYSADEKVVVSDITAYIGTSGNGPQSVIFVKDGLLILIKSTEKLTSDQWASYIASLG